MVTWIEASAVGGQVGFPLWVQILALSLAPLVGILGIIVGGLIKDRSDRRAILRTDRRDTYLAFARSVSELDEKLGGCPPAPSPGQSSRAAAHLIEVREIAASIVRLRQEIDLIGSPLAAAAADTCYGYVVAVIRLALKPAPDRQLPVDQELESATLRLRHGMVAFRDSCLADLGVPRRQRGRPDSITLDAETSSIIGSSRRGSGET